MVVVEAVFWTSFFVVSYVYVGYPLLVAVWSRCARRPVCKGDWQPTVSLVIAAHNERETIVRKLDNCLELDYPADKLEVVVSLDGPTDGTDRVVLERCAGTAGSGRPVRVVRSVRHEGKAAALNRAVAAATGQVLVFCDARQRIEPQAVRELVADLADPSVGAVTGELMLLDDDEREAADGVGLYWRYEKLLRSMESRIHSTVGATGALYAIRRELYQTIPGQAILDDVFVPMAAVLAGKRTVFEPLARALDHVCPPELEFRRKVRTLAGNFQLLALMPELLQPWRNPVFVQFLSHKLGRLLAPHFLLLLLLSNLLLRDGFYLLFLVGQCSFYLLAGAGWLVSRGVRREPLGPPLLKGGHRQP
ncbi:MAG TPA: glycosyltransferase family 2 protein [Thermoanaerobaculia bacterium]|nr:glycosyltransferase family 2 protein [Thermoanaerobaculia bacterium]